MRGEKTKKKKKKKKSFFKINRQTIQLNVHGQTIFFHKEIILNELIFQPIKTSAIENVKYIFFLTSYNIGAIVKYHDSQNGKYYVDQLKGKTTIIFRFR